MQREAGVCQQDRRRKSRHREKRVEAERIFIITKGIQTGSLQFPRLKFRDQLNGTINMKKFWGVCVFDPFYKLCSGPMRDFVSKEVDNIPEDDTRGSCLPALLIFTYTCIHTYVHSHISNIREYMHMHSYTYTH